MKRFVIILLVMACCGSCFAQKKKNTKTVELQLPGYCCKKLNPTIENTLAYEKGVVEWTLDRDNKKVTVTYKEGKTTPDTIEKALARNGVRTQHYEANPKMISKLPACCQPAAKGEPSHCK